MLFKDNIVAGGKILKHKKNPFDRFVMKREQRDRGYLELHELKALEDLEGLFQALALKRDAFLYACYTGSPYSELKKLNHTHVLQDNDGMHYIKISGTKNNEGCIIPLLPKAISILSKYSPSRDIKDFLWTIPSNQKFNDGIKSIWETG